MIKVFRLCSKKIENFMFIAASCVLKNSICYTETLDLFNRQ